MFICSSHSHSSIGTTECAVLLRYFGLRAEVVDFGIDEHGRYLGCTHSSLQHISRPSDAVCDVCGCAIKNQADGMSYCCVSCEYDLCQVCYLKKTNYKSSEIDGENKNADGKRQSTMLSFVSSTSYGRICKPSTKSAKYLHNSDDDDGWEDCAHLLSDASKQRKVSLVKNDSQITSQLVNWLISYFRLEWPTDYSPQPEKSAYYLPPLYFQHQGHSRTIVGLEDMNNKTSLLIFDPLSNGALLKKNMEEDLVSTNGIHTYMCICKCMHA